MAKSGGGKASKGGGSGGTGKTGGNSGTKGKTAGGSGGGGGGADSGSKAKAKSVSVSSNPNRGQGNSGGRTVTVSTKPTANNARSNSGGGTTVTVAKGTGFSGKPAGNNALPRNQAATISKSTGKVTYGPSSSVAPAPAGSRTVEKKSSDGGFFSAGKQLVSSLKNTFGPGPSAGRMVTDPKTGKTYKEPVYKPLTFKGLTSKDPENVARNREAAKMYADKERDRQLQDGGRRDDKPFASAVGPSAPAVTEPTTPAPTPQELANIGAPTTPMGPVEVSTPSYGLPSVLQPGVAQPGVAPPAPNYGMAFQGGAYNPYADVNFMDIFGSNPNMGPR